MHCVIIVRKQILVLQIMHPIVKKPFSLNIFIDVCDEVLIGNESHSRQNYSNHFDNTHLGLGSKGIDGFILNIIFKSLITRFNMMEGDLLAAENISLYSECRMFLIFMKENHGGIFRSTVFSVLIDPEKKLKLMKEKLIQQNDSRIRVSE